VITHPFHPLAGQPVEVVGRERRGGRACFRCLGGPLGTIVVPAEWTDRAEPVAGSRLTYEVLVELAAAAAAIRS
jgi:hypothetical protein